MTGLNQRLRLHCRRKSTIEEVKAEQGLAGTKYSIGVYDRITSATWKYRNMVLPL